MFDIDFCNAQLGETSHSDWLKKYALMYYIASANGDAIVGKKNFENAESDICC